MGSEKRFWLACLVGQSLASCSMRILIITILCVSCFAFHCAHAQLSDALLKEIVLDEKSKAETGDAKAQSSLGDHYAQGLGVGKNYTEAVKWYRKAAEQNDAQGQFGLGFCYANGHGVAKNDAEAVKWYRKAAEQNFVVAQYSLGNHYEHGQGVETNYVEAVKWYRKGAEHNIDIFQFKMGHCYALGLGVETNYVEADAWYNLAARTEKWATTNCDYLEKHMSPEQIAAAQKRAKELQMQIEAKLKSSTPTAK